MNEPNDRSTHCCSRRDLLCGSARYAALAGISLLSGGLVLKRALAPADRRCSQPLDCRRCPSLGDCSLPDADAARQRTLGVLGRGQEEDDA